MPKILHCADIHLDTPFKSGNAGKSEERRRELRQTFSSMMRYIKENGVELALIAGDLFDSGFVTKDTADFVARELASASPCIFVISPGNHDPYTKGGVYESTDFSDNVYIFDEPKLTSFYFPEINTEVYGYAFTDTTLTENPFAGRVPSDLSRINILAAHADVGNPLSVYCPVSEKDISDSGFDYCAFGHVHGSEGVKKAGNVSYAYSGCIEGRDFGETGHKGAVVAEINKEHGLVTVDSETVRFSKRRYEIMTLDISGAAEKESTVAEVAAAVSSAEYGEDTLLRLVLAGNVSPSLKIPTEELSAMLSEDLYYVEVINRTLPLYDVAALEKDPSIRGAFFRELRPRLETGSIEERAAAARALRIGLAALSGEDTFGE